MIAHAKEVRSLSDRVPKTSGGAADGYIPSRRPLGEGAHPD